ncbi:eclosion hormone [Nesidiocoris tenuis]|uniref:Eclosion hormone n=1 Tax=Nesidiocoris tenuis TaxID=355587 RepID=A0ABN7AGG8_9HEMI|nr:eclosion hormone [Nesidiocoris tenuis]
MAALPSPTQVAGEHSGMYEVYFSSLEKQGTIPAVDAAKFLKKSGLSDLVLSTIWDLSDPNGKGYLNRAGFYTALKLVSLAQIGQEVSIANTTMYTPPPKLSGQIPSRGPTPTINSVPATLSDWGMKPLERAKYEQLFESLQPLNGVIPGNKVKGLLIDSKLPVVTLGKIWDLADMDKDGSLDKHEFIVAMHLVYKALEKYAIPNSLPPELLPPDKRKNSATANVTPLPQSHPVAITGGPVWLVTPEERAKYDNLFIKSDVDKDGYVSGLEIKDVFLQSGVPQSTLADIWGLCDIKQSGKLNSEQFALAMWLINQKLKGIDPPLALTPEMIPPSMRTQVNGTAPAPPQYSNPELELIGGDIEELLREQAILTNDILNKEAEIKVKSGEAKSLQGEYDTLAATLKQLDNQKGEAGRRLNDLKNQVEKLKSDAEEQEALVKTQEEELSSKKRELEALKEEETRLQDELKSLTDKLNSYSASLQESHLTIIQAKTKIDEILDHQRQLKEAIEILETALSTNDTSVSNRYLEIDPEYRDPSYTRLINPTKETEDIPAAKVASEAPSTIKKDSFVDSAFKSDPFASSAFSTPFPDPQPKSGFGNDPFSSFSPVGTAVKADPFDPFGNNSNSATNKAADGFDEDAFGCEPFGAPAPALPPKNKQPPPRPAPPRPAPPAVSTATTPTPAAVPSSDGFADFSAFNSKGTGSLDFTEDPFKDYRYEDTFNIEDPFDDDDNAEESNHATSKTVNDPFAPADVTIVTNKAFSSDRKNNNTSTISGRTSDQSDIAWFAFDESNCNENGRKSSEFYS